MSDWQTKPQTDLEVAISEFKAALPGWWYSLGECQVSCDASCAPTVESPHIHLIRESGDQFDAGFHVDLQQPSTLAEALRAVMHEAVEAIRTAPTNPPSIEKGTEDGRCCLLGRPPAEAAGAQGRHVRNHLL